LVRRRRRKNRSKQVGNTHRVTFRHQMQGPGGLPTPGGSHRARCRALNVRKRICGYHMRKHEGPQRCHQGTCRGKGRTPQSLAMGMEQRTTTRTIQKVTGVRNWRGGLNFNLHTGKRAIRRDLTLQRAVGEGKILQGGKKIYSHISQKSMI